MFPEIAETIKDYLSLYGQAGMLAWIILIVSLVFLIIWSLVKPICQEQLLRNE